MFVYVFDILNWKNQKLTPVMATEIQDQLAGKNKTKNQIISKKNIFKN